ncbi:MAG: hypothetical protein H6628_09375 [Calditrichae bacterium]|nr:hypothetical protein [Calditrichia bacterium]
MKKYTQLLLLPALLLPAVTGHAQSKVEAKDAPSKVRKQVNEKGTAATTTLPAAGAVAADGEMEIGAGSDRQNDGAIESGNGSGPVSLVIGSGDTLAVDGDMEIVVSGDWQNNGVFKSGSGMVNLTGSGTQAIGNPAGESFNHLTVNKPAGAVQLNGDISVSGTLTLSSGDLDLNGNIADLGTSGTLAESAAGRVKGASGDIRATRDLNAPSALNVAGLGAELSSSANLGATEIRRGHAPQSGNSHTGIERYYDIIPANNTGLDATLKFNYLQAELNGLTEEHLVLFRSTDSGSSWRYQSGTADTTHNAVTLGGIDAFSRWTAATIDQPIAEIIISANLKAFLEGPFDSDSMRTDLTASLPLNQPYDGAPWNYSGAESVSAIPADVVDWVLIELRSGPLAADSLDSRAAFIKSDGSVVDTSGSGAVSFKVLPGDYYLVLYHRNHLAAMSAITQTLDAVSSLYDFSSGIAQYYGNSGAHEVVTGIWGMVAGDGSGDGGGTAKIIPSTSSTRAPRATRSPISI